MRAQSINGRRAYSGGISGEPPLLAADKVLQDRYRILRQLGQGGMGTVYEAIDERFDSRVAIKECHFTDDTFRRQFQREARLLNRLHHPAMTRVIDHFGEEDREYLVMDFVPGQDLYALLQRRNGPFATGQVLRWADQLLDVLCYLHGQVPPIIHRDIKPENLKLSDAGQIILLDFGLSKGFAGGTADRPSQSILGFTPAYAPLEQMQGAGTDPRADLYSLAATLHHLLTGVTPPATLTRVTSAADGQGDPLRLASELNPSVSAEVAEVLHRAMAIPRGQRHASAAEMRSALTAAAGSDLSTEPTVVKGKAGASPGRNPLRFRRAAIGLIAAAVITGALFVMSLRDHPPVAVPAAAPASAAAVRPAIDSAAYNYYLRGKVNVSSENAGSNEAAIRLFQQALTVDPNFAAAHAQLARAWSIKARYFAPLPEKKQINENAEVSVEKALALDPELAEGHFARGLILWTHEKRFPHEQAIESYRRAIRLDPNFDEAHHQLGFVLLHIGLLDEAQAEIRRALAINPANSLARYRLGVIAMCRAKYEDAFEIFNSTPLEKNPSLLTFYTSNALFRLGRNDEATALIEKFLKEHPKDEGGAVTSVRAMILASAGREREAKEAIRQAIEFGEGYAHFHHTAYNIASAYALMNEPSEAMRWLQVTTDDGFPCYPLFEGDRNLDHLRKDARFAAFLAKVKRQWERH